MRNAFLKKITELARADKEITLLTADLGYGVFEEFEKSFPNQYINVGVAEQAMTGIATGLAMEGKKVFILGAGGVVPSIIFALNKMNVSEIIISNRTKKKAEDLKSQFHSLEILDWGDIADFDIIINATSLGLNKESINIDLSKFRNNKLFYDVIYNPAETNFLSQGKKLGNRTENGKLMFVYQALEAFKLWHGIEPTISREVLDILKND